MRRTASKTPGNLAVPHLSRVEDRPTHRTRLHSCCEINGLVTAAHSELAGVNAGAEDGCVCVRAHGRSEGHEQVSKGGRSVVSDSATPRTAALQAPPSQGCSRQGCWSGLPFPSPGDLPNPGIEPRSPTLQADALPSEPPGKAYGPCLGFNLSHLPLYPA